MSARKRTTSLGEASLDVLHHDYPQSHIQTTDHQPRHLPRIFKSETESSRTHAISARISNPDNLFSSERCIEVVQNA